MENNESQSMDESSTNEVPSTPSPESSEQHSSNSESSETPKPAVSTQSDDDKPVPYSRFKEVIEFKNQQAEQLKQYEQRFKDLESRLQQPAQPATPKPVDKFVEDLRGVNPEYAKSYESVLAVKEQLEQMRQYQDTQQKEALRSQAISRFENLLSASKITDKSDRELYGILVENAIVANPKATLKDIDVAFKQVHDRMTSYNEAKRRADRASYVTQKKSDGTPASVTGGASATPLSTSGPKTRQEVIAQVAKEMRENKRVV